MSKSCCSCSFFFLKIFHDLIEAAFMLCLSHHRCNSTHMWETVTFFLAVKIIWKVVLMRLMLNFFLNEQTCLLILQVLSEDLLHKFCFGCYLIMFSWCVGHEWFGLKRDYLEILAPKWEVIKQDLNCQSIGKKVFVFWQHNAWFSKSICNKVLLIFFKLLEK